MRTKRALITLGWYFGVLSVLPLLSLGPGATLGFALLLSMFCHSCGLAGEIVLLASSTLLYYSALLLLPLFLLWPLIRRHWTLIVLTALPPLAGAIAAPLISQAQLNAFVAAQTRDDFDRWQPIPIKTVAIGTNAHDWSYRNPRASERAQKRPVTPASRIRLVCTDTCQRLLFNHEVAKVVMVGWSTRPSNNPPATTAYWIERTTACWARR